MESPKKILGLLRHAKYDAGDPSLRDFERGLNGKGRRGAALMGRHIRGQGVTWDRLIASPAERVRMTLAAASLGTSTKWDERLYLADSGTLLDVLREIDDDPAAVLIAGHNPGLQELIFELVAPESENQAFAAVAEKFPTASFAVIELPIERWAECAPGRGTLVHLARPRDLDPELGPLAG